MQSFHFLERDILLEVNKIFKNKNNDIQSVGGKTKGYGYQKVEKGKLYS